MKRLFVIICALKALLVFTDGELGEPSPEEAATQGKTEAMCLPSCFPSFTLFSSRCAVRGGPEDQGEG